MALQLRRGTEAQRTANNFIPEIGEPIYTTDTKALYIGDGSTVGGIKVGTNVSLHDIGDVYLPTKFPKQVTSISAANNVVTVTTADPHGFITGDSVDIQLNTQSQLNGTYTVTVLGSTLFTYPKTGAFLNSTSVTGTATQRITNNSILAYDAENERWIDQTFVYRLIDLGDVSITSPQENQILRYSSSTSKWTNQDLSISINELDDVQISGTPQNGQILTYNTTLGAWVNQTYTFDLEYLSDVDLTSPANNQVLLYNGSQWVNSALLINSVNLDDLGDVQITSASNGQLLQYTTTGSKWINTTLNTSINNFSDVQISSPQADQVLAYSSGKWQNKNITLENLSDVSGVSSGVADREVLAYDSTIEKWTSQVISSLSSRQSVTITTGSLANNAVQNVDFTAFTGYAIIRAQATAPCIITLYAASEDRVADASRNPSTSVPPIDKGIFAELKILDVATHRLGPVIMGYNDDATISRNGYARIKNTSGATQNSISVTLTVLQVEEDPA